ncbi:cytochrome b [Moraxella oblonga]|uniref:cytochrome b n=1 Tax=Moraxella oblonga TaxID=200413 RepID=UPI00082F7DA7|nr:cytochrome b [Moraxella oblonga]
MNTQNHSYGKVSRYLHWAMAVCYLAMFGTAVAWNIDEGLKFLMNPHKALGILLLALTVVRIVWAISQRKKSPPNSPFAKLGHLALYGLMFIVPAIGMARQAGYAQNNQALIELGNQWHGTLAWVFLILIVGHIAMVAVHHIKGDKILSRMLGK